MSNFSLFSSDRSKQLITLITAINCVLYLQATAEANNLTAVAEAKDLYLGMMENICGGAKPFLATAHLESEHHHCVDSALRQFQNKRKMGGEEFSQIYMEKLIKASVIPD